MSVFLLAFLELRECTLKSLNEYLEFGFETPVHPVLRLVREDIGLLVKLGGGVLY